jgi:lycopene beta-cyclase
VLGEENGVLPVVSGGRIEDLLARPGHRGALAGTRAGLFHPMTSYSLPDALRFALALARQPGLRPSDFPCFSETYARNHWKDSWYYRVMTALLFDAARPDRRYRVLQRFYGLNQRLIERFYAGKSTWKDRARILAGKPPLPVSSALGVLTGLGTQPRPLVSGRPQE